MTWEVPTAIGVVYAVADISRALDTYGLWREYQHNLFHDEKQAVSKATIHDSYVLGPISLGAKWLALSAIDRDIRETERLRRR